MKTDEPHGADRSLPELLQELSQQVTTLVQQELALLRTELGEKGKIAGQSAGLFAGGSLFGIGAFGALTIMFIALLSYVVALWIAALIVAIVYGIAAAVAAKLGKDRIDKMASPVPKRTVQSVRNDAAAVQRGVYRH